MLPNTLAFVAFFFGIAAAQTPPAPGCHQFCCGTYVANGGPAFKALLGDNAVMPTGTFGTACTLGNCTATDVGKQNSCCLYFAQFLQWTSGCDAPATSI